MTLISKRTDIILAVISGAMLMLCFPPFDVYPFAWIALVPLLLALTGKKIKTAFYLGLLTGLVYFVGTVYWVSHSMYFYGNIPAMISLLGMLLLCIYLSLYTGVFSMLFSFASCNSRIPAMLSVPVLWVTLEYVRAYALTGFPWSSLGYSQYKFLPLIQISDVTGVYGVSFIVAAVSGAVFDLVTVRQKNKYGFQSGSRQLIAGMLLLGITIIASLSYGLARLNEKDTAEKVKVSVVQGNIPQDRKWDQAFQREVMDTYMKLTYTAVEEAPELIVWPETAMPFIFGNDKDLTDEFVSYQKSLGIHMLFGSMVVKNIGTDNSSLSNSAILISPEGNIMSVYDKIHLVPYGEYVPLREFFPFIKKLTVGVGDFYHGRETVVMQTPFGRIGNLICYEIIFPGLVRKFVDSGANVLVTITNDAWFGRTSAPYQHFSMAVLRAVENRVPVVRAANTGISGFIDSKGRITGSSDIFTEAVLTENITTGGRKSFYAEYGDIFAYICIVMSVFLLAKGFVSRNGDMDP